MMQVCTGCGASFPTVVQVFGLRLDLRGRRHCLACMPHRPLRGPRRAVVRSIEVKACDSCRRTFPKKLVIDGKMRSLYRRRFCLACSPFGAHNTATSPPGAVIGIDLIELRRRRKNASTYRYQKRNRRSLKAELVRQRGGCCEECGYARTPAALEFHHRDAASKEFQISRGSVSRDRLWSEASKCDLLCANCHRKRHPILKKDGDPKTVVLRRQLKQRAVTLLGSRCQGCGSAFTPRIFEFHHIDARTKEFAISADGILRPWDSVVAELVKCVLVCANCHREIHAGIRVIEADEPALSEAAGAYRSAVA